MKQLKNKDMETIKNYQVRNTITNELDFFDTIEQAQDHVRQQIKWYSSPKEVKNGTGYDGTDFPIEEITICIE